MSVVRVMTWNVRGSARPDLGEVAAAIRACDADVVALQEIRAGQARRLARRLGHHHRWARKHFPYGVFLWWRAEGLAVLSPHHLEGRHRYLLSPGVHSWTFRRRIALRVKVRLPGVTLRVFDVHLASHEAGAERIDQATILAGVVAAERRRAEEDEGEAFRAVVAGDLNADGEPEVLAPLEATGFTDAWAAAVAPPGSDGFTCPADAPRQRIDYVLIEDGDECLDIHVPSTDDTWQRLSDHLPVVARVRVR